jgi:hypothetical protein
VLAIKIISASLCVLFALMAMAPKTERNRIIIYSANSLLFAFLFVVAVLAWVK